MPVETAGEADEEVTLSLEDLPESMGMLVVKRGPNAGSKFVLDTEVTRAGRHPDSEIFLDDVTVSRRHAEVVHGQDGYLLRDVGSLNGTYLNRERIENEAPLRNGDELQIGKFKLVFFSGTGEEG
jgi:pSer/pThr/pTyr-binding forkhead associated (FHA) protein